MKKVLLVALATFMALPAFAATIYSSEDGKNKVEIYGNLRAYVGVGVANYSSTAAAITASTAPVVAGIQHYNQSGPYSQDANFLYGLQNNSRLGFNVKLGAFSGQVEFGANEKTLVSQTASTVGIRQAWAKFSSKNCGWLAFGKMNTPTSMGGFISTAWDNDNSLLGFGGSASSVRRFQVAYGIAGFTISLVEKENNARDYSVRPSLSYAHTTANNLHFKIGLTAAGYRDAEGDGGADVFAGGITFGLKKKFNIFRIGFIARVGLNEQRYEETGTKRDTGKFTGTPGTQIPVYDRIDNVIVLRNETYFAKDALRAGVAFEFGWDFNKLASLNLGVGYQATVDTKGTKYTPLGMDFGKFDLLMDNAVAVYIQAPIRLNEHWHLVPEIGTHINVSIFNKAITNGVDTAIDVAHLGLNASFYALLQLRSIF